MPPDIGFDISPVPERRFERRLEENGSGLNMEIGFSDRDPKRYQVFPLRSLSIGAGLVHLATGFYYLTVTSGLRCSGS
jgi:hypothetical protein